MDLPEHNALAALPPFVTSILCLTRLFSDRLPPPQWNICHISALSSSPREPQIVMLLANKDMRWVSVMNPQFNYCFFNDGLTHNRGGCQFHLPLQWSTLRTAWCVSRQRRTFVININFLGNLGSSRFINSRMTTHNTEPVVSFWGFLFPTSCCGIGSTIKDTTASPLFSASDKPSDEILHLWKSNIKF